MRKTVGVVVVAALLLGWSVRPADASSAAQHRWEGAAIALGTIGLIAVLNDVAQAQPVAVSVGSWHPGHSDRRYCPPPPARARLWVPGYWEEVDVWVSGGRTPSPGHAGGCGDRHGRHRGHGRGGHHEHDRCGCGSQHAREEGGRHERRRVWKEGYYR